MRLHAYGNADELRDLAAAIEAHDEKAIVALSLPTAWLLRDLIGLENLSERVKFPMREDMQSLNRVLGHRVNDRPHVSRWSERAAAEAMKR